jgi:uncharacterized Zn finger protein (UPF0148 family)
MSSDPTAPDSTDVAQSQKATDGDVYVVDEHRDAVVAGPYQNEDEAADEARERGPDHIVASAGLLRMMEMTSTATLRWETGDVDVVTDGGLDAETVLGSVAPGDVVEVASRPCRVVDVDGDVLRLYDLVERTESLKAAAAGDLDRYVHRSEEDVIEHRVREERELREDGDADPDESDVDEGEGVETDGGVTTYDCPRCGEVLECNVDDRGQRRCPDCGCAVTAKVTDGGSVGDRFEQKKLRKATERQAAAMETVAEELAYQNAALTEVARALHIVAQAAHDKPSEPPNVPTPTSMRTYIEDHQYTRQEGDG